MIDGIEGFDGIEGIDAATREALAPFGFEESALRGFAERARLGARDGNAVSGEVQPPAPEDLSRLPPRGSAERAALAERGARALERGEVGVIVLAGGMATRFGGVVKATMPVFDERSFLELELERVARSAEAHGARVPVFVMTSWATHREIERHVRERGLDRHALTPLACFPQFVSLRLDPEGALFRDADGALSPYATGHGDLSFAMRRSGLLARFREGGGRLLFLSNVDNLGASLDPAILGLHLEGGAKISAEVVEKEPGDRGGVPARVDGRPRLLETFCFPEGFDGSSIPVFNTNTLVLDAEAIDRDFPLPFHHVEKQVEGATTVQFERLVGELTVFLPSHFLLVPREGEDARFLPVKDPAELERRLPALRALFGART